MGIEFSHTVDALPGLMWVASPDGRTEFVNRCWREYSGLSTEEASGHNWLQVVHPDDRTAVVAAWEACLNSETAGETEARMRRHDGVYRWFVLRASPLRDASGNLLQWCGVCTDIEDHKRAEGAVRAHEERFKLIIDGLPTGVLLVSPEGLPVHANRYGIDYFKKPLEELGDLRHWATSDMIHPDDRQASIAMFATSVAVGRPYESETRYRRGDGVYRWFRVQGFPLRDEKNLVVLWYFLFTDIEERKRAEALLAGEKRLLEMVAVGVSLNTVLDALCRLVEEIDSGCHSGIVLIDLVSKTLQRGGASTLTSSYLDALHGLPAENDAGPGEAAALSKAEVIIEDVESDHRWPVWRNRSLAHGIRACWAMPILSRDEEPLGAFAIFRTESGMPSPFQRDLIRQLTHIASIAVERAYGDLAVKRSMESFRAITETTPECVKLVARDGTLLQANSASASIAGVPSADALVGKCFFDFVAPEHRQGYIEFHQDVCAGRKGVLEFDVISADGKRHQVETYAAPMERIDGTVAQLGVTRDITARKQAEEAIGRLRAELAHVSRVNSLGALTGSIAHEINQPLGGIVTNASAGLRMLGADPPNIEGALETLRRTLRDGRRASDVVKRLRALFSKNVSMTDTVDINEAVDEVIELLRGEIRGNRILLRQERPESLPPVTGDRVQLQQVVLNLLLNAMEAMQSVTDRPRHLLIRTEQESRDHVLLAVSDAGSGLDPQHAGKLFDAFYTTKSEGMGIGLSVSRSIIEAHGGHLRAVSNEGPGATFSFSIPCNPGAAWRTGEHR